MTTDAGFPRAVRAEASAGASRTASRNQIDWARWIARARLSVLRVALRLDRPHITAVVTGLAYLAFLVLRLHAHGGDFSAFVYAGDHFVADPARVPPSLHVQRQSWGYDGQYYYALSLNPFTSTGHIAGLWLDNPPYRQQRILYPLMIWALSLGRASLVPALLVLVNYLAMIGLAWVAAVYAQSMGRHALWGLLVAVYPGFVLSLARDLPDPLAALLVVGSLVLLVRGKRVLATLCLTLAIFTRETVVLIACAAALVVAAGWAASAGSWALERVGKPGTLPSRAAAVLRGWEQALRVGPRTGTGTNPLKPLPWYYAAMPLAALVLWEYVLTLRWHVVPVLTGHANLARPFLGIDTRLRDLVPPAADTYARLLALETRYQIGIALVVALALWASRAPVLVKVAWAVTVVLGIFAGPVVWGEDFGFVRALADFFVLGALILLAGPHWNRWAALAASVLLWVLVVQMRIPVT